MRYSPTLGIIILNSLSVSNQPKHPQKSIRPLLIMPGWKNCYDMGGLLTVGTDPTGNGGTIAGYGNWRAIELLVKADGFTPLEALKIATKMAPLH